MLSLGIMLIAHLYFIIGNNLRVNLTEIFDKRNQIHFTADAANINIADKPAMREKLSMINQELDANYQLLRMWNSISAFGYDFKGNLPQYTSERLAAETASIQQPGITPHQSDKLNLSEHLNVELYKARITYFTNIQAADFFLESRSDKY